jgi:tetratricopeptide (TPR) repeat protein
MNSFQKAVGFTLALMLSGCAGADSSYVNNELPQLAVKVYKQSSPDAELMYHILVAELAGKRNQLHVSLEHYHIAANASTDPRIAERAANIALFIEDNAAALKLAQRWYDLAPTSVKAQQTLTLALLRNHQQEEALMHLDALREIARGDSQEGFGTVNALLDHVKDKKIVFQVMEQLQSRYPQSQFARYYYALAALEVEHHEQALKAINVALDRNPQWGQAYLLQARVMMAMENTDAALESLAEAVAALPQDRRLRNGYARLLVNLERLEEAREQFQILSEQDPEDGHSLFALGLLAAEAQHFDEAVAFYKKALQFGVQAADVYYELGKVEELRNNYRKAKDWYERVASDDRYLSAQIRAGMMLAKLGDFPSMSTHFIKLRRENPQSVVPLYISEAEILREEDRGEAAFNLLSKALDQNPNDEDLLYSRSLAAESINRLEVAERDLRILIEADSENGQALNALGYTLADRTDRYQEALGYLQRALALLPDDAAVLDSMGWVLYRLGRYEESLNYLRRAYEASADDEIAAHLSEVLWMMDKQSEAQEIWQRAMEKAPESEHLLEVKGRLNW